MALPKSEFQHPEAQAPLAPTSVVSQAAVRAIGDDGQTMAINSPARDLQEALERMHAAADQSRKNRRRVLLVTSAAVVAAYGLALLMSTPVLLA